MYVFLYMSVWHTFGGLGGVGAGTGTGGESWEQLHTNTSVSEYIYTPPPQ